MTWHCASCGTTLTWAAPIMTNPGMQKCPRCDKWMERVEAGDGTQVADKAKGRCPYCGRVVAGKADGIEYDSAGRRFVVLRPHSREPHGRGSAVCLPRGGYRRVPRVRE